MLASDLNNPEFVGARNPDSLLQAEFNWREVKTMFGKPVLDADGKPKRSLFCRIQKPGDDSSIINTPARDDHKKRFPRQWLEFQMKEGGPIDGLTPIGWLIDEWKELSDDQLRELKYLRFSTVEQIAYASDLQIQRVGMGGMGLREKAKAALRNRMDAGVKAEIETAKAETAKRDDQIRQLQEQMAKLLAVQSDKPVTDAPVFQKPKRKYTRKAQQPEA